MSYLLMRIINNLLHPFEFLSKIRFKMQKSKFKKCGKNVMMGRRFLIREPHNIEIGDNVFMGHDCVISCWADYHGKSTGYSPLLRIANNVTIGSYCALYCLNSIIIDSGVLFGDNVSVFDNFHGELDYSDIDIIPIKRNIRSKGPVHIGKNVWVGKNVCIMPNVTIGNYSIVGANSVVTHDVSDYSIVAGAPAKVIKRIK